MTLQTNHVIVPDQPDLYPGTMFLVVSNDCPSCLASMGHAGIVGYSGNSFAVWWEVGWGDETAVDDTNYVSFKHNGGGHVAQTGNTVSKHVVVFQDSLTLSNRIWFNYTPSSWVVGNHDPYDELGGFGNAGIIAFGGHVFEILMWTNVLSDADIVRVLNYCTNKFAIVP